MLRKILLSSVLLAGSSFGAEIFVQISPPRPVIERRVVAPGPGYVWCRGYHRWDGDRYVWVPGVWAAPPHRHAHWVDHRWEHRRGGYVFVEGHWR